MTGAMLLGCGRHAVKDRRWRRVCSQRALATAAGSYRAGQVVHGFEVQRSRDIPEFDMSAIQLKHRKTGADYVHVFKNDTNNVFNVGFHTPVSDSTGVPHILEHTTLCGSKRFPVRDPFFKMLNRSMATFMNALTGADYTMYPFSTENPVDFRNLMDVYLDATFHPLLRELDFKQEGWRLEHEIPNDASSPLVFKGVVYNEMKGALSDLGSLFYVRSQEPLYKGTTYEHVSGGDPDAITNLTYQQLVDFQRTFYHPSNAKFFTYGTFDLTKHLKMIDSRLKGFDALKLPNEPMTPVLRAPKRVHASCPPDPMSDPDKQTKMAVSFLTNEDTDTFETFAMRVLTSLLMDGAAAPMFKALIEPNIGSGYAATTGYNQHLKLTNVSFGLQGIKAGDVDLVEEKIMAVLKEAAATGFDAQRVESVIHQTELGLKHRESNFGMMISQQLMSNWVHGGDPFEFMEVTKHINTLRQSLRQPGFFEAMIEKYFLANQKRVTFVMQPDEQYSEKLADQEQSRLRDKVAKLAQNDKEKILTDGIELAHLQSTKEDVSVLPTLAIDDIAKEGQIYPVTTTPISLNTASAHPTSFPVQWRQTATNGISYTTLAKRLSQLPADLHPYLTLFCTSFSNLGTSRRTLPDLDEAIRLKTGGISASVSSKPSPVDLDIVTSTLSIGSNCLDENIAPMYELIAEVLTETRWDDVERLRTVVLNAAAEASQGVAQSGHRYAMSAASGLITKASARNEVEDGLAQVAFLGKLARNGVEDINGVVQKMTEIAKFISEDEGKTKLAVISSSEVQDKHKEHLASLVDVLGWRGQESGIDSSAFTPTYSRSYYTLPLGVNFTGKSYLGVPYTHGDAAPLQLLASLLTHRFLHREIREKGGAYGGGASYSALNGTFNFYSYRDPAENLDRTLHAYDKAVEWASEVPYHIGQQELDEAKLATFQAIDRPLSAAQEGQTVFTTGITPEMQQARRERLFSTTLNDIREVAEKYLVGKPSSTAVLGDEAAADKRKAEGWNIIGFD
ncbi:peptidase M16C associated-domain-containing protein [Gaertneriomyces semiglobifer]|nr:peptidase M16C associated-domain-containing protein [Gaertneriomyces semiglobifer]